MMPLARVLVCRLHFLPCSKTFSTTALPVLTLFTKEQCELCEKAKAELHSYKNKFALKEIYIDQPGQEQWFSQYKFDIPVFHLNGKFLMKHRVNHKALQAGLEEILAA